MDTAKLQVLFNRAQIDDRQVNELIGLAQGLIADGKVVLEEADYLQKWLVKNFAARQNPLVAALMQRVSEVLADGVLSNDESMALFETLRAFSGGDFELGELQKTTTLPFNKPAPEITFKNSAFCFTGTFGFGSRKKCEAAVTERGGSAGSLTMATNYLVVGVYATDGWAHSSYGRKIEQAVEWQNKGRAIQIVSEEHWSSFIRK